MDFDEWWRKTGADETFLMGAEYTARLAWGAAIHSCANELRTAPRADIDMHLAADIVERMRSNAK
jgi:hypothetical protein